MRRLASLVPASMAAVVAVALGLVGLAIAPAANAQVSDKPFDENWAPTEWGADDRAGSVNRTTSDMVLNAIKLVKQGKTATLGKLYAPDVPFFGPRSWNITIPGTPTGGPFGENALVYHDELVNTEIGQVSTQFDGPGHIGVNTSKGMFFYNGQMASEAYQRGAGGRVIGMGGLGVEHVAEKGFVCRGVLLDAPAYKGMNPLPIPNATDSPGIVSADDVKAMVERQGLDPIGEGDCVFLYTGHGDLWLNGEWKSLDAAQKAERVSQFLSGEPGFGLSACEYLAERKIILTGGDTSAKRCPAGQRRAWRGAVSHRNADPSRHLEHREPGVHAAFCRTGSTSSSFVWSPLKIVGGTGSPGNPVALY